MAGIGSRVQIKVIDQTTVIQDKNWKTEATTILRTWAEVRLRSSSRLLQSGQAQLGKFFEFRFRYRGSIELNANTRIVYNGERHTLQSAKRENQKDFYWIVRCDAKSFT